MAVLGFLGGVILATFFVNLRGIIGWINYAIAFFIIYRYFGATGAFGPDMGEVEYAVILFFIHTFAVIIALLPPFFVYMIFALIFYGWLIGDFPL